MKIRQWTIVLLVLISGFLLGNMTAGSESAKSQEIWILRVDDTINPVVSDYMESVIESAQEDRVACIIIELDTPGGVLESTHAIVQTLLNATVPIVVYVSPQGARAASAGVFITLAAHIAAMSPATNIGAAHPVSIGPSAPQPESPNAPIPQPDETQSSDNTTTPHKTDSTMEAKIMNDTLAWARSIATNRNRNVTWIESAVRDSISATETEALEAGIIDIVAESHADLLIALHGRVVKLASGDVTLNTQDARIVEKLMPFPQRFLSAVINPTIAIYLLAAGLLGLYIEITHPGLIFPGVVGAICLILALFAMHTLPINYAGLILMLLAFGLFAAEVKVQSFGLLTIGGVIAFVLGASMLIDYEMTGLKVSIFAILPLALSIAGITFFLVGLVIRTHSQKTATGMDGMIGLTGYVRQQLSPEGTIFIHGEIWKARSADLSEIDKDRQVEVTGIEGLRLVVKTKDTAR